MRRKTYSLSYKLVQDSTQVSRKNFGVNLFKEEENHTHKNRVNKIVNKIFNC